MSFSTQAMNREFTTLFAELVMRTVAVSVSGAAILIGVALLLLA